MALAGAVPSVGPSLAEEEQSVDMELGKEMAVDISTMAVEESPGTTDLR
jgi:hypothetical protein